MIPPRILVAGVGNIFFGDDAFGVEVVRRLAARPLPEGVRVVDFGIRGLDLAYTLLDEYDAVFLVDAVQRGGPPGALYLIEPEPGTAETPASVDTHGMHPTRVLQMVRALGGRCDNVRIVGCEPATFGSDEDPVMGLSVPVEAAVDEAVRMIEELLGRRDLGFTPQAIECRPVGAHDKKVPPSHLSPNGAVLNSLGCKPQVS